MAEAPAALLGAGETSADDRVQRTADCSPSSSTVSIAVLGAPSGPKSILRRGRFGGGGEDGATSSSAGGLSSILSSLPSHWPSQNDIMNRPSAHFPPGDGVEAAVYFRPRTHILDVPHLYYSPQDIKRFKREYRQLVRVQAMARDRLERNSLQQHGDGGGSIGMQAPRQHHDNSFWRSKVTRRWSAPSTSTPSVSPTASSPSPSSSCRAAPFQCAEEEVDYEWDPLNDGSAAVPASSPASDSDSSSDEEDDELLDEIILSSSAPEEDEGGSEEEKQQQQSSSSSGASIFSSVFSFGGVISSSSKAASHVLVDTLYLF